MILYFSATGNCQYVAQRIAAKNEETVSVTDCLNSGSFDFSDEVIGIISPTYSWGLPSVVADFLKQARLHTEYLYFVATYGTTPAGAGYFANRFLDDNTVDAYYSVKMPDTWTATFDLSTPEKVAKFTAHTEEQIDFVIASVSKRKEGNYMRDRVPLFAARLFYQRVYDNMRRTSHFIVEDTCIGCGLCARKCPVNAIELVNKKPVWIKQRCAMCLGCLHRCPKFSIQYGNRTQRHGQYTNPHVKL